MNTETDTSQKRFLRWALAIAATLFFVITLATIGVVWWTRKSSTSDTIATSASVAPPVSSAMANWSPATFSVHTADGLHQTSEKSWSIKGGRAFMNVRRKDDDSLELRFVYPFDGDFLPQETIALVRMRWGVGEVEKLAGLLNITPEQVAALKAVSPATDIPVSAPDKQRMKTLFEDYLAAKDSAAEKALVDAVTEIDKNYYDRTLERIDGIVEKVKTIFNQDQSAALSERFGSRNR
jgi:hypothetical protein